MCLTLPLGGERAEQERSGSSGSESYTATWCRSYRSGTFKAEWQCDRYARGRVAVQLTLPLGGERAGRERSGSSGSVGWDDLLCAFEKSTGAECVSSGCLRSSRKGAPYVIAPRGGCRKVRLSVRPSSNRDLRAPAQPAPQAGGGLLERICPVEPFPIVPRSLAGGCSTLPGCRDVTEKRILCRRMPSPPAEPCGRSRDARSFASISVGRWKYREGSCERDPHGSGQVG